MSTADSNLHALSAVLTRDIHANKFLSPEGKRKREKTWFGRAVSIVANYLSARGLCQQ